MPYSNFRWSSTDIDVLNITDDSPKGYILEVDLLYPKELRDLHSDFPLAPEYQNLPKHLTTIYDKERYVVHYTTLKPYLKLGLKLEKIRKVLEFNQTDCLKKYVGFNTNLRARAKNDFEKDFIKLMNKAVFGKSTENIRNRVDIKLCSNEKKVEKLIAKPNFEIRTIFADKLIAIHMTKPRLFSTSPFISEYLFSIF